MEQKEVEMNELISVSELRLSKLINPHKLDQVISYNKGIA